MPRTTCPTRNIELDALVIHNDCFKSHACNCCAGILLADDLMAPRPAPLFPPSNAPRTWLITAAASPIGLRLSRSLLDHGDNIVLGLSSAEHAVYLDLQRNDALGWEDSLPQRVVAFARFINEDAGRKARKDRTDVVVLDGRCGSVLLLLCGLRVDVA